MARIALIAAVGLLVWAAPAAAVELRVYPGAVDAADAPDLVLLNDGRATVTYGLPFALDRWTGARWRWINRHQAWPLPLLFLEPGQRSLLQTVGVYGAARRVVLPHGLYRVRKAVDLADGRSIVLGAAFRVFRRPTGLAE